MKDQILYKLLDSLSMILSEFKLKIKEIKKIRQIMMMNNNNKKKIEENRRYG